jgi:hypothetical protein
LDYFLRFLTRTFMGGWHTVSLSVAVGSKWPVAFYEKSQFANPEFRERSDQSRFTDKQQCQLPRPAMPEDGGLRQLTYVLEASAGSTLARSDAQLQSGRAVREGALGFYEKNPQALQRDKRYFETWYSALAIADAGRKSEHKLGRWESSTTATWIALSQRTDAWGHAFCIQSDQQQTIVVSPDPQALSSLDCNSLKVSEDELAQMPQARLNPHASGALILFVKKSDVGPTGNSPVGLKVVPKVGFRG